MTENKQCWSEIKNKLSMWVKLTFPGGKPGLHTAALTNQATKIFSGRVTWKFDKREGGVSNAFCGERSKK